MSKLLITSIGQGIRDVETQTANYRPATYIQGQDVNDTCETPYIFHAIAQLEAFQPEDKLVLIGTAGSDWYSLYKYLIETDYLEHAEWDETLAKSLSELLFSQENYKKDITLVEDVVRPIEELLKQKFQSVNIIILQYGINDEELTKNFDLLQAISEMVEDQDEIIFDITHSFRSLALFELITVNYIKEVMGKKVKIKKVTYGMLEISKEMGQKVPIVDLAPLITTMDCMKAIDEFNRFGTTYSLCEIMQKHPLGLEPEEQSALNLLNDNISANDFHAFKQAILACGRVLEDETIKNRNDTDLNMIANKIYKQIYDQFKDAIHDEIQLQAKLALWHYDKKRYIIAAMTLMEDIVSFGCEICEIEQNINVNRDNIRKKLNYGKSRNCQVGDFLAKYNKLRKIRNGLAHPVMQASLEEDIKTLGQIIKHFNTIYQRHFTGNLSTKVEENRAELRNVLTMPIKRY